VSKDSLYRPIESESGYGLWLMIAFYAESYRCTGGGLAWW